MKIKKGMYGLKQAAILTYQTVFKLLTGTGYVPIIVSLGLLKHTTKSIQFCLCVDDFGVKYDNIEDLHHLQRNLQQVYTANLDTKGENFLGFTLK